MSTSTQTRRHHDTFHPEQTSAPESVAWDGVVDHFTHIVNDADFLQYCADHQIDATEQQSAAYADGLATYIEDLCAVRLGDGTTNAQTAGRLLMLGEFPRYLHQLTSLTTLRRYRYSELSRDQKQERKDSLLGVIGYNQLMSEHLYQNPNENIIEIGAMTAAATGLITPGELADTASQHMVALKGARVEAVSRQVLDALVAMAPDGSFTYRAATPEEDAKGIDAVTIFDGKVLNVDFKASLDGVESDGIGNFASHTAGKDYAVKTGHRGEALPNIRLNPDFTDSDLGDTCQLSPAVLMRAKLHMMHQLMAAYNDVYAA
jgi:hypothetical protein